MKRTLFLLTLAIALLASCVYSDDAPCPSPAVKGGTAWLALRLLSAGDGAPRAKAATYYQGDENAVRSVDLYFYSSAGVCLAHEAVPTGDSAQWTLQAAGSSVEKTRARFVAIRGLKGKTVPAFLVAVLNRPDTLSGLERKSLQQLQETLIAAAGADSAGYFLMTNSGYNNNNASSRYFATPLSESNFLPEPAPDDASLIPASAAVNVYVERLCARVEMRQDGVDFASQWLSLGDYAVYDVNLQGEVTLMNKELFVKFTGWGLNATAPATPLEKSFPTAAEWSTVAGLSFADEGKSSSWALTPYTHQAPTDEWAFPQDWRHGYQPKIVLPAGETDINRGTNAKARLRFLSYADCLQPFGTDAALSPLYCHENAPQAACLNSALTNFHACVTEAILACRLRYDGEAPRTLIRYLGEYYTEEAYLRHVLSKYGSALPWTDDDGVERQMDARDFTFLNLGDGWATPCLTPAARELEWTAKKADPLDIIPTVLPPSDDGMDLTMKGLRRRMTGADPFAGDITLPLDQMMQGAGFQPFHVECERWNEGRTYYHVPLEHTGTGPRLPLEEGQSFSAGAYGVVRNHRYQVRVASVTAPGTPVNEPREAIIPHSDARRAYHLGARVYILPWRFVDEDIHL